MDNLTNHGISLTETTLNPQSIFREDKARRLHSPSDEVPAVEHPSGYRAWYRQGEFHRTTGPAIIYPDGREVYSLFGFDLSKSEFEQLKKSGLKLDDVSCLASIKRIKPSLEFYC